jgi:hypothetical protein
LVAVCGLSAGLRGHTPTARAEDTAGSILFAYHATSEAAFGRTFVLMAAPVADAGAAPSPAQPVSGKVEICAGAPDGGRLAMFFSDENDIEFSASGCEQRELQSATDVSVNALRGEWDIVVRRLEPAAPETGLVARAVPTQLGQNISVMTATGEPGHPPVATAPFTGTLEVCIQGPQNMGVLHVLFDDARTMNMDTQGCRQAPAAGVHSVTLLLESMECDVVIRRLS